MKNTLGSARGSPTQTDVARRAGVSRALVSLVLRGGAHVKEDKRTAVLTAMRDLGYRANGPAQLLAAKRTRLIGVLAQDLRNPFYGEVIEGIQDAARSHNYRILVNTGHGKPSQEAEVVETFLELRVDGLILIHPLVSDDDLARIAQTVPTVVVGRDTSSMGIDSVEADEMAGGTMATQHLIGLGHRRIVYVNVAPDVQSWSSRQRSGGYLSAMAAAGLETLMIEVVSEGVLPSLTALFRSAKLAPTAFFAYNDMTATSLERTLRTMGLRTPEDVAVVGYDNTILASAGSIGLTSVDQSRAHHGNLALDMVLERINGREPLRHHTFVPQLIVRESTDFMFG